MGMIFAVRGGCGRIYLKTTKANGENLARKSGQNPRTPCLQSNTNMATKKYCQSVDA
jgi:hypothetical protein